MNTNIKVKVLEQEGIKAPYSAQPKFIDLLGCTSTVIHNDEGMK